MLGMVLMGNGRCPGGDRPRTLPSCWSFRCWWGCCSRCGTSTWDERRESPFAAGDVRPVAVATLWAFFVLRAVRWYGMATCRRTGWGTRRTVEVALAEPWC
jgi:hypothetical protein